MRTASILARPLSIRVSPLPLAAFLKGTYRTRSARKPRSEGYGPATSSGPGTGATGRRRTIRRGLFLVPPQPCPPPPFNPGAEACLIKGNVNGRKRIYHMPGTRHYEKVEITPDKGDRYFCTEDDASRADGEAGAVKVLLRPAVRQPKVIAAWFTVSRSLPPCTQRPTCPSIVRPMRRACWLCSRGWPAY